MKAEYGLKAMLSEYAKTRGRAIREKYDNADIDKVRLYDKIKGVNKSMVGYLPACVCALLIIAFFTAYMGYTGADGKAVNLEAAAVSYDYSAFPKDGRVYLPTLLPEGYDSAECALSGEVFTIRYCSSDGELTLAQGSLDIDGTERLEPELDYMEKINLGGSTAYFAEAEGGYNQLIWSAEGTDFALLGTVDREGLCKIAQSIK